MNFALVVEGPNDALFFKRLLKVHGLEESVKITVAGGKNAARPIAAKLLRSGVKRVALVYDADTTDPESADLERDELTWYLGRFGISDRFLVTPMVPELEIVWFDAPDILGSLLGAKPAPLILKLGRQSPKMALGSLGEDSFSWRSAVKNLTDLEVQSLGRNESLRSLLEFLTPNDLVPIEKRGRVQLLLNQSQGG